MLSKSCSIKHLFSVYSWPFLWGQCFLSDKFILCRHFFFLPLVFVQSRLAHPWTFLFQTKDYYLYCYFYTILMFSTSSVKSREGSHGWPCFLASFCSSPTKFRNTIFNVSQDPWFDLSFWYLGCGRAITISFTSPSMWML